MEQHDDARERETERQLEQIAQDICALMCSAQGRRFAWWVLEMSGVYHSSYRDNPQAMAYAEGKRAFGNQFLDWLSTVAPQEFLLMQQEALYERHERRQRLATGGG